MRNSNQKYLYDVVMPIGPNDSDIALMSIKYIFKYFSFGKLFIISNESTFKKLSGNNERIIFLNEDDLIPGITLSEIKDICKKLFDDADRGGWYFQQFLKMGISQHPSIREYYLVWDADTIPLKSIDFFDNAGKMLLSFEEKIHQPYFNTLKRILNIDRQVNFSFITEHMMIKTSVMNEVVSKIEDAPIEGNNWTEKILRAVNKNQYQSGFSEFETYGNYLAKNYPDIFSLRKIKHKRSGSKITNHPNWALLKLLSFYRETVSFEKGHH
ncbi:MAG: DUF6492 family protein [Bacteroidota bacterium]